MHTSENYVLNTMKIVLLISFFVTQILIDVSAEQSCSFYHRDAHDLSGQILVKKAFSKMANVNSIKMCEGPWDGKKIYILDEIQVRNNTEFYSEEQVFYMEDTESWSFHKDATSFVRSPPSVLMCKKTRGCEGYSDDGFIIAQGLSVGAFKMITSFFERIMQSKKYFNLSISAYEDIYGASKELDQLGSAIFDFRRSSVKLDSVYFEGAIGIGNRYIYTADVSDSNTKWSLLIDFRNGEPSIEGVSILVE